MANRSSIVYFFRHMGISIGAWIGAATLFSLVRLFGVEEEDMYTLMVSNVDVIEVILIQGILVGTAFGIFFSFSDLIFDRKFFRQFPYWAIIALRTILHILVTLVILTVSILATHLFLGDPIHVEGAELLARSLFTKTALVIIIYTGVVSVLFNLIRQMNSMFGPGILFKIITGKYHHPKEEERIFMFLDLKSSTTYAERLGHVLYSELIQDCFYDLTDAVQAHNVSIYQYVGDEAVLTWTLKEGFRNLNCIEAFFSFERSIQARADYYFNKYDLVPAFKAGVNVGLVMVAEVGVIKKEIAYHSDVLNTAARIQGRCNEFGKRLLISDILRKRLEARLGGRYHLETVGTVSLKGKQEKITIHSVEAHQASEHKYAFSE
ncbi:MAG: adenylate/guanylate cyclase domain-containing protein [Bacteroidota bacterium]